MHPNNHHRSPFLSHHNNNVMNSTIHTTNTINTTNNNNTTAEPKTFCPPSSFVSVSPSASTSIYPSQQQEHNTSQLQDDRQQHSPFPTTSTTTFHSNHTQQHHDFDDSFFRRHSSTTVNNETNNNFSASEKSLQHHHHHQQQQQQPTILVQETLPSLNNLLQHPSSRSIVGNGNHQVLLSNNVNLIEDDDGLPPRIDMSRIRSNSSFNQQQLFQQNSNRENNEGFMNQSNFAGSKSLSVPTPPSASYLGINQNHYSKQLSPSYFSNNQMLSMQYEMKKTPSPSNSSQAFPSSDGNQLPSIHSLTNDMMDTTSNNSSSFVHKRGHSDPANFPKTVPYNFTHRGNHLTNQHASPSSPSTLMSCSTPNLMSITTPVSTPSSYVSTARSVVSPNTPTVLNNAQNSSSPSSNPPTIQITSKKSKTKSVTSPGYDQLWFNTKYRFMGRNKYTEFKTVQGDAQTDSKITKSNKMKKNLQNANSPIQ